MPPPAVFRSNSSKSWVISAKAFPLTESKDPSSRKVGFMVIGVYDLRASNTGPPECQKSTYFSMVKVLGFIE